MKRFSWSLAAAAFVLAGALPAGATSELVVEIDRAEVATSVGTTETMVVTISNRGSDSTGPLLGHLLVVDPASSGSADAEDWTTDLTRPIGNLDAGGVAIVEWNVKPISSGDYHVLFSVVSESGGPAAISPSVVFRVSQPRGLVSGVTLPVSAAVPLLMLALAVAIRRRERRRLGSLLAT
ncbi:MAG: hypothetical protein OEO77_07725 [Acidimicrobiia bacterium]|nr:hypothetical protein [Acidimicrobiia bacterium]